MCHLRSMPDLLYRTRPPFVPPCTPALKACALRALGMNESPVNPTYTRARALKAPLAFPSTRKGTASHGRRAIGVYRRKAAERRDINRTPVSSNEDKTIDPRDASVERVIAAWTVYVSKGWRMGAVGLRNEGNEYR